MTPKRTIRYHYLKFTRLKGSPRSLARSTAIGTFLAVMPIMPVRTVALIVIAAFLQANIVAALIVATLICNPFTYVPLYYFAMITGNALTPYTLNWERVKIVLDILVSGEGFVASSQAIVSLGMEALIVLIVGGIALAIPASLITYGLSLHFFTTRKKIQPQGPT